MLTDEESAGRAIGSAPVAADLLDAAFVPVQAAQVARAELDGETVLWHAETGVTAVLDPIGGVVWECFDGSGSIDEIAADLSAVYRVDVATVRTDVLGVARELGRLGLLEGVAPAPAPGHDHAGHDHAGHDHAGHADAGHADAGHDRVGHHHADRHHADVQGA